MANLSKHFSKEYRKAFHFNLHSKNTTIHEEFLIFKNQLSLFRNSLKNFGIPKVVTSSTNNVVFPSKINSVSFYS